MTSKDQKLICLYSCCTYYLFLPLLMQLWNEYFITTNIIKNKFCKKKKKRKKKKKEDNFLTNSLILILFIENEIAVKFNT